MTQEVKHPPKKKNTRFRWIIVIPVILAAIACIQAIAIAFLNPELIKTLLQRPSPTPSPEVRVMPPAASETSDIIPFESPTAVVYSLGEDWQNDCISEQWQIYPFGQIGQHNGCYNQPIWEFISTQSGGLYILAQHKDLISADEYGLFGLLPQSADISFTVNLDLVENAEVWFGVFSEPRLDSDGILIVVPPDGIDEQAFAVRLMPNQKRVDLTQIYLNSQGVYNLGFNLERGTVNAVIENSEREKFPFSSPQRWLFIGYRAKLEVGKGKAFVTALVSNLVITPK